MSDETPEKPETPTGLPDEEHEDEISPLGTEDDPEPEHDPSDLPGEGSEGDTAG